MSNITVNIALSVPEANSPTEKILIKSMDDSTDQFLLEVPSSKVSMNIKDVLDAIEQLQKFLSERNKTAKGKELVTGSDYTLTGPEYATVVQTKGFV